MNINFERYANVIPFQRDVCVPWEKFLFEEIPSDIECVYGRDRENDHDGKKWFLRVEVISDLCGYNSTEVLLTYRCILFYEWVIPLRDVSKKLLPSVMLKFLYFQFARGNISRFFGFISVILCLDLQIVFWAT